MLHRLIIRKYNISLVLLLFSDSLFPCDKSYFLFAKKIRDVFTTKRLGLLCFSNSFGVRERNILN